MKRKEKTEKGNIGGRSRKTISKIQKKLKEILLLLLSWTFSNRGEVETVKPALSKVWKDALLFYQINNHACVLKKLWQMGKEDDNWCFKLAT